MSFVDISKGASKSKDTPPKSRAPKTPAGSMSIPNIKAGIGQILDTASLAFVLTGDAQCSSHFADSPARSNFIEAWGNLAERNIAVRRTLTRLLTGSAYTEVIVATFAFTVPVAQHHGLYPSTWINPFAFDPENIANMMRMAEEHANGNQPDSDG